MSSSDINRKIAVIFATDVVGYSKHMEKDEDATLSSLNACNKIIEPLIKKQKGRIFNTGGDSVFAEFPSAVATALGNSAKTESPPVLNIRPFCFFIRGSIILLQALRLDNVASSSFSICLL